MIARVCANLASFSASLEVCILCHVKGGANSEAFHAFRRACGFYSWYRLRPTWWAPAKSKDIVARARTHVFLGFLAFVNSAWNSEYCDD